MISNVTRPTALSPAIADSPVVIANATINVYIIISKLPIMHSKHV